LTGGVKDHVHALFSLHRTWSVSDITEEVKKSSSKWIKTKGQEWRNFQWQAGYGAFSVSQSGVAKVKRYIANQKAHHAQQSFQNEFRGLLRKYEVEYDERYVWD
jgi:REP element-mobilizing transposase RayT